ncbi:hypothetical protein RvY_02907 [Ramazzottius varieornatus]|uniref:Uncharacterized protein n=1 Tax=Ramazzottius varieornatus TaxID=947166 RepID=A0A1D1UM36_RAMVA|nr:hypothetical protein RvY_02907 [Ramazzottius varieornatus]
MTHASGFVHLITNSTLATTWVTRWSTVEHSGARWSTRELYSRPVTVLIPSAPVETEARGTTGGRGAVGLTLLVGAVE